MGKQFGIARQEKRKAQDIGGIEAEAERMEPMDLPNSEIDWSRTKDNYRIVDAGQSWRKAINAVLAEHGIEKKPRKDAVLFIDGLYTASNDSMAAMTPDEQEEYFRDCVSFHEAHFGPVFSAVVHMDETTPHMHVASVPLVQREDGSFALSAKDLMGTQKDYRARQDSFYTEVSEKWGLERGTRTDPEHRREHKDVMDYKIQKREEEYKELEAKVEKLEQKATQLEKLHHFIDTWTDKVMHVFDLMRDKLDAFMEKVERKEKITDFDLKEAACDMHKIGRWTKDEMVEPIYSPRFGSQHLSWDSIEPVYISSRDGYDPIASHNIETREFSPEWDFNEYWRPSADYIVDMEIDEIEGEKFEIDQTIREIDNLDPPDIDNED